jgi:hypothetical protein
MFGETVDHLWARYRNTWGPSDQDTTSEMSREQSVESQVKLINLDEKGKQEAAKDDRKPREFVA